MPQLPENTDKMDFIWQIVALDGFHPPPAPTHNGGKGGAAGSQPQMQMVGDQRPRETDRSGVLDHGSQPIQKVVTLLIVLEDIAAYDTTDDYVVQDAGGVDVGLPGNGWIVSGGWGFGKFIS